MSPEGATPDIPSADGGATDKAAGASGGAPAGKGASARKAAPAGKGAPAKKTAPARKTAGAAKAASTKAAPATRTAGSTKAAPAKKAAGSARTAGASGADPTGSAARSSTATSWLKVTQVRSAIGTKPKHRGTLGALGLRGIGRTNLLPDRPEIRGMLARVPHLVEVAPVDRDQKG